MEVFLMILFFAGIGLVALFCQSGYCATGKRITLAMWRHFDAAEKRFDRSNREAAQMWVETLERSGQPESALAIVPQEDAA